VPIRALACLLGVSLSGCFFEVTGVPLDASGAAPDFAAADDLAGVPFDLAGAPFDLAGAPFDLATAPADLALPLPDLALPLPDLATQPDLLVPFCGEPNVVACYQFEDGVASTTAHDGTANHNDLALSGGAVLSPMGHAGGALSMNTGALAHVAHNVTFDVSQLTIEMWIKPTALPGGGARAGFADEDGQYGLFVYNPGVLLCSTAGATVQSNNNQIVTGAWHHVACTYDLAVMRLYYDGVEIATHANSGAIATNQPNGLCIGSNSPNNDDLDGLIDDARIFGVARTAALICADAGGNGC